MRKFKFLTFPLPKSNLQAREGETEGEYPFFTSSEVQDKFVDQAIYDSEALIFGTGGRANVHYYEGKFATSGDTYNLKPQETINGEFLFHYLSSFIDVVDEIGFEGMGLRHLQKDFLSDFLCLIPKGEIQNRIVVFLHKQIEEYNKIIQKNKKQVKLLQEYRQALISNVVTGKFKIENGKLVKRNPSELKDSGIPWLGKIPKEWEILRLRCVAEGFNNGISETQIEQETDYPVSRIETISSGKINPTKIGYIGYSPKVSDYKMQRGDVLLSHINSLEMVGNCAVYGDEPANLLHGMNLLLLRPNKGRVCSTYFPFLIRSYYTNQKIKAISKHAINQVSVNSIILKGIKVPLPTLEEQKIHAVYLQRKQEQIGRTIGFIKSQNQKIQEYKKSLIYNVVTGKIKI